MILLTYVESLLKEATQGEFEGHGFDQEGFDSLIEAQFKLVTEMEPSEYQYMSAQLECNKEKNPRDKSHTFGVIQDTIGTLARS